MAATIQMARSLSLPNRPIRMIITYPIEIPYTCGNQQRVLPDSIYANSEMLSGSFPMGKNRFWHGGVHLHPADRGAPIRAIADGELVAYRYDETDTTDEFFDKKPYSRSFVLLKHETELGQTSLGTNKLTFYSLYMHLKAWGEVKSKKDLLAVNFHKQLVAAPAQMGKPKTVTKNEETTAPNANGACNSGAGCERVKRGDILGYSGSIPDNITAPSCGIHFEIFFDDIAFLSNPCKAVWGKTVLTESLETFKELISTKNITVDPNKKVLRSLTKGMNIIPWIDPWLKAGEFREETINGKTWIQVYLPEENRLLWADKNCVKYTSDADWPDFHKLEESGQFSEDGFMDDVGLQAMIAAYNKDREEKNKEKIAQNEEKLRHLITRHPSEWSKQDIAKRFQRITTDAFGAAKLSADQFNKLTKHIERLAFWEDVVALPNVKQIWHPHPVKFIEHLAKCMWLSKPELALIYPKQTSLAPKTISHGTSDEIREKYRMDINKCCFKYGVNTRLRLSHFFGQGAIECESLNSMTEKSSGNQYEGRNDIGNIEKGDGPKFKGRGFKQLTGRYNYSEYWVFRGWLKKGVDFDLDWAKNPSKCAPNIETPELIANNTYNCIDIGTWYSVLLKNRTLAEMDNDNIRLVTHAINGGHDTATWEEKCNLEGRINFTRRIKDKIF